jgi:hypothetical protein
MPKFIQYDVEYTNMKPYKCFNIGSGRTTISLPEGCKSVKAKLKRTVERNINSLGVRIDSFKEIKS